MALHTTERKQRKPGERYIYPSYGTAPAKFQISVKCDGKARSETFTVRLPKSMDIARLGEVRDAILSHIAAPESTFDTLGEVAGLLHAELKAEASAARRAARA